MAECSDLDLQIQMLRRREIISEEQVSALCVKARELLMQEGNVQPVDSPVTVRPLSLRTPHLLHMPPAPC